MKLIEKYEKICNKIIIEFAEKQGLEFDYWIVNTVGEVACLGGYYFDFKDVCFDLKTNQLKGLIMEWHDETIENYFKKKRKEITYQNYCKGFRYKNN